MGKIQALELDFLGPHPGSLWPWASEDMPKFPHL